MTSKKTLDKKAELINQFGLSPVNTSCSNITVAVLYGDQFHRKQFDYDFSNVNNT